MEKLLHDHSIPYKLKKGSMGTRVMVKRSLADEAEMEIREARDRNWLW